MWGFIILILEIIGGIFFYMNVTHIMEFHRRLYLERLSRPILGLGIIIEKMNGEYKYERILQFLESGNSAAVLKIPNREYGTHIAKMLFNDGYLVLYASVPDMYEIEINYKESFNLWFNSQFKNIFWYCNDMPRGLLKDSNIILILDNYDNIYLNRDRELVTNSIAISLSKTQNLFKTIFISSNKEFTKEILTYNDGKGYINLNTKSIFSSKEIE